MTTHAKGEKEKIEQAQQKELLDNFKDKYPAGFELDYSSLFKPRNPVDYILTNGFGPDIVIYTDGTTESTVITMDGKVCSPVAHVSISFNANTLVPVVTIGFNTTRIKILPLEDAPKVEE